MHSSPWQIILESDPDAEIRAKILQPLAAYNESAAGPAHWGLLALTVRDPDGKIVGGLWGRTGYGFLFVELLALGPAKGQGLGRELIQPFAAVCVFLRCLGSCTRE